MDEKINKADKKPFIIVGIIIVLLIICIVCLLVGKLGKSKTEDLPSVSEKAPISEKVNGVLSGDSRFLVVASEGMHTKIDFMFLIDFKVYSEKIIITKLSRDTVYNGSSYAGEYAYGGIDSLLSAVEGNRQIEIDRYAIINKNGFSELTDTMGSVMLNFF